MLTLNVSGRPKDSFLKSRFLAHNAENGILVKPKQLLHMILTVEEVVEATLLRKHSNLTGSLYI